MKNTSTNKSKSGKYYWWAQSPPVDILTRKFRNQSPKINDSFHMLRDSTACLFVSELIKGKYIIIHRKVAKSAKEIESDERRR